jgi:hypothetical protein
LNFAAHLPVHPTRFSIPVFDAIAQFLAFEKAMTSAANNSKGDILAMLDPNSSRLAPLEWS